MSDKSDKSDKSAIDKEYVYDYSEDCSDDGHCTPQNLVSQTPSTEEDKNNEKQDYFTSLNRSNSKASRMSGWSQRDIYGDETEENIQLARQATRETIISKAGDKYNENEKYVGDKAGTEFAYIDPELVTWDGPDDPENPRNWSTKKKWITTLIVSGYATVSPISSSILSPAVHKMSDDIGLTNTVLQSFSVSIFLLAWAICPLFLAPISETFGRRAVLNISISLLVIFNLACGFAKTPAQILVLRFLGGAAGSPPPSVAAAVLYDCFKDEDRNPAMSLYSLGPLLGPVIAPIIAGFIAENLKWQWTFYVLAIITAVTAVVGILFYEESYAPKILANRAKKLRKDTGNEHLHTIYELTRESLTRRLLVTSTRPLVILATQPVVFGLGLFMAVIYGLMYLMLVTFPKLWTDEYGYDLGTTGLMYLGLGVGFLLGLAVWTPAMQYSYMYLSKRNPNGRQPEYRIALVPIAATCIGTGLLIYDQTAERKTFWFWPVFGTAWFAFGLVCAFSSILNYLTDAAVENWAASTNAAASVFRSALGATFPLFGPIMYAKLGYAWANTICGIAAFVLGIPFPIIVFIYGARLRAWTTRNIERRNAKKNKSNV